MKRKKQHDFRDPKWFATELKYTTDFANELPRAEFYSETRDELREDVKLPFKKNKFQSVYGLICFSLSTIAIDHLVKGAVAVVNGEQHGWTELRRGFLYDSWAARFRHAFIIRDNCYDAPHNPASAALFEGKEALTLCHAIATGDDEFAHGFGKHLLANFEKTKGSDKVYFYTMPFFPFVLKLYSIWIGQGIDFRGDVAQPLGRYQKIFDYWESPSELAEALLDICDLHCEEARETGDFPAFAYRPYELFPVEIISIYRVRQYLDLETPRVVHPILESKLVTPPPAIPFVEDELLDCVAARFRADIPDAKAFV